MYNNLSNHDYIALEVGKLMKTVQYIEYNLVELIKLKKILSVFDETDSVPNKVFEKAENEADELSKQLGNKTLGQVINIVKKSNIVSSKKLSELEDILRKRNDLVHHYFKRKDFEKHEDNNPFIENEYNYLKNFNFQSDGFNDFLCEEIDKLQEEYDSIN